MALQINPRFAVILVNWRGAEDTIECLASLFCAPQTPYVIVVDNDSQDGSIERIAAWAAGKAETPVKDPRHRRAEHASLSRPIETRVLHAPEWGEGPTTPLTLIHSGGNLGFAGGNNTGLRFAMANPGIELFWLLNNDTIVDPAASGAVAAAFARNPRWGMAGTRLRLYHHPDRHQLINGQRFSRWTGSSVGIAAGSRADDPVSPGLVMAQTDFVCGASMIVTRPFLERVGLMEERFFLYYEEIDWTMRASGKFEIGYVDEAIAFHKEGGSAGSASHLSGRIRSPLSEYHHIRSKMIFCRKHLPLLLPVYFAQNLVILARRLVRRHFPQARAVMQATFVLPYRPQTPRDRPS